MPAPRPAPTCLDDSSTGAAAVVPTVAGVEPAPAVTTNMEKSLRNLGLTITGSATTGPVRVTPPDPSGPSIPEPTSTPNAPPPAGPPRGQVVPAPPPRAPVAPHRRPTPADRRARWAIVEYVAALPLLVGGVGANVVGDPHSGWPVLGNVLIAAALVVVFDAHGRWNWARGWRNREHR